jgi:hypothetical protein
MSTFSPDIALSQVDEERRNPFRFRPISVVLLTRSRVSCSVHDSNSIRMTCVIGGVPESTESRENMWFEAGAKRPTEIVSMLQIHIDILASRPVRHGSPQFPAQRTYVLALTEMAGM